MSKHQVSTKHTTFHVFTQPVRDKKILSDHRQDGNDEVHRLQVRLKKKKKRKKGVHVAPQDESYRYCYALFRELQIFSPQAI